MYYSRDDIVYIIVLLILSTWGITANAVLLYTIIYRSPKYLSPYRIFLGNTALSQLFLAANVLVTAPRLLTEGLNLVIITLGPAQLFGAFGSFMLFATMIHFAANSFVSLMISMIYRFIVFQHSNINSRRALMMCFAGYIMPFSMVLPYLSLDYSTNPVRAVELTHYVVPNVEKYAVVLSGTIVQPCILWLLFCSSFLNCVIYAVTFYFRRKIFCLLRSDQSFSSAHTAYNVEQFVKALTLQSLVVTFTIFPPIRGYLLIQFGILRPQVLGYFIAPCLCLGPMLDPIITMYYISPYRLFIESVVRKWRVLTPPNSQQLQARTLGTSAARSR